MADPKLSFAPMISRICGLAAWLSAGQRHPARPESLSTRLIGFGLAVGLVEVATLAGASLYREAG